MSRRSVAALAVLLALVACTRERHDTGAVRASFVAGLDTVDVALASLGDGADRASLAEMQQRFRVARASYKRHETLIASEAPSAAGRINGPVPDDDDDPSQPLGRPAAFQRIEASLFGKEPLTAEMRGRVGADVSEMRRSLAAMRQLAPYAPLTEAHVADALRAELARLTTLSLAGFDSDESGDVFSEVAAALDGMGRLAASGNRSFEHATQWRALADTIGLARSVVLKHGDGLDRLRFITTDVPPVGRALNRLRVASGAINDSLRVVWRSRAATVFEPDAFDVSAYAPAFAMRPGTEVLALGERLFNEPALSGPRSRACSSCHVPQLAFTDGVPRHGALGGGTAISRNTPTLLNVALQPVFFADGRAATLEDQIRTVLASPVEMSSSAMKAAERLRVDSSYRAAFARVGAGGVTEASLRSVLATYVRSLVRLDSRFDAALQGDATALTDEERRGFNVFMGKARCATCHFVPLLSGVAPPEFRKSEPEVIGVPARADTVHATLDADPGRAGVDRIALHRGAFAVPTLRNVARTAPYMHHGAYATLEQVIDFYDRGGGTAVGALVPNQTLPSRPLRLTAPEKRALLAFLRSLDDREPHR